MAFMPQTIPTKEIKKTPVAKIRENYATISDVYNKMLNGEIVRCPKCGRFMSQYSYYHDDRYHDGLYPICKDCMMKIVGNQKKPSDQFHETKESIKTVLQMLDKPFLKDLYESSKKTVDERIEKSDDENAVFSIFSVMYPQFSLTQYRNMHWKDSDIELPNDDTGDVIDDVEFLKTAKRRFGNYSKVDLTYLENEFQDWVNFYGINTKAQKTLVQCLCLKQLEFDHAQRAGKDTSKIIKDIQDIMASLNVKPSQSNSDQFTDNQSFGQLIELWEQKKPIPQPEDEFKDPDHMVMLVDGFFKGHLAKMLGIKNGFSRIYDGLMNKYTVKHNIDEDDEQSEEIFNKMFGKEIDKEEGI